MKKEILLFTTLFLLVTNIFGQIESVNSSFSYEENYEMKEVVFYAPECGADKWIKVYKDPIYNPVYPCGITAADLPASLPDLLLPYEQISGESNTTIFPITPDGVNPAPVGYVSGCAGKVSAKFQTNCPEGEILFVKGENEQGFNLPAKQVTVPSGGIIEYPPTSMDEVFPENEVKYFSKFRITWKVAKTINGDYKDIEKSECELFITHQQSLGLSEAFLTFLMVGCKYAIGSDEPDDIVSDIYQEFASTRIRKHGKTILDDPMTYWGGCTPPQEAFSSGPLQNSCFTGEALVAYEDATCGAWSDFFRKILALHGIEDVKMVDVGWLSVTAADGFLLTEDLNDNLLSDVNSFFGSQADKVFRADLIDLTDPDNPIFTPVTEGGANVAYFFVKNWQFQNSPVTPSFYGSFGVNQTGPQPLINGNEIIGAKLAGVRAQGIDTPKAHFKAHGINKYDGKYYDPSYGSGIETELPGGTTIMAPFTTQEEWIDNSIQGYGTRLFYETPDGDYSPMIWVKTLNSSMIFSL